jgi:hypothetical protein
VGGGPDELPRGRREPGRLAAREEVGPGAATAEVSPARPCSAGTRATPEERLGVIDESDPSVLRERADGGDEDAVDQLIELAGGHGNLAELRRLADQGNSTAGEMLAELEE